MEARYDKLVRDKIPSIIRAQGRIPVVRALAAEEYQTALVDKLREEVEEFAESRDLAELAGIWEVVVAVAGAMSVSEDALRDMRREKAERNGTFEKRIFLEKVVTPEP